MNNELLQPAKYSLKWFESLSGEQYNEWRKALTLAEAKKFSQTQTENWQTYLFNRLVATTKPALMIWAKDFEKSSKQEAYTSMAEALLDDYCFACDMLFDLGVPLKEEG